MVGLSKYRGYSGQECEHIKNETMFMRESSKLQDYFNAQMANYLKELNQKGQMIEQKTLCEFNGSDWTYNSTQREWTHRLGMLKFQLERGEASSQLVLKDKLVACHKRSQMPKTLVIEEKMQMWQDVQAGVLTMYNRENTFTSQRNL